MFEIKNESQWMIFEQAKLIINLKQAYTIKCDLKSKEIVFKFSDNEETMYFDSQEYCLESFNQIKKFLGIPC